MKNKLMLGFCLALLVSGCAKNTNQDSTESTSSSADTSTPTSSSEYNSDELAPLPEIVARFIDTVNAVGEVNLDSGEQLDQLIVMYYAVSYSYRDYLERPEVVEAKEKMDQYIAAYKALLEAQIDQELSLAYERRFLDFCKDSLPDECHLLLEQRYLVNVAYAYYASLTEESKEKEEVSAAKEKVDALQARFDELAALSDSEYAAYEFVIKMNDVDLSQLVYQDKTLIEELNEIYEEILPEDYNDEVAGAKEKLDQANTKMEEYEVMQEHAAAFMDAAWKLPSNLRYQDSSQEAQINAALALYDGLTDEEKEIAGVAEAYANVLAVKSAFESLKEPFDINVVGAGWSFKPNNQMTFSGGNPYSSIASTYGYTLEEVESKAKIRVDVYQDGAVMRDGVPSGNLYTSFYLSPSNYTVTLHGSGISIADKLEEAGYTDIQEMRICFTVQIESLVDNYGTSYYCNIFGRLYIRDQW